MTSFSSNDFDRLDWQLLSRGAVTLYWKVELFQRDMTWLSEHGYTLHQIDCSTVDTFQTRMTEALQFKQNFGYEPWTGNLDALNDAFRNNDYESATGVAFCFSRIDLLLTADRRLAEATLDLIAEHSRDFLLTGDRLLALAQSDDATISIPALGGRVPHWNHDEWLNSDRGV